MYVGVPNSEMKSQVETAIKVHKHLHRVQRQSFQARMRFAERYPDEVTMWYWDYTRAVKFPNWRYHIHSFIYISCYPIFRPSIKELWRRPLMKIECGAAIGYGIGKTIYIHHANLGTFFIMPTLLS
jgi:hypothetical protein